MEMDKILENCQKNLSRGRAVATGIGIFAAVFDVSDRNVLLRNRAESDSLYGKDLSGKWELIGGGVELDDFTADYTEVVFNCLKRELAEEAGLDLIKLPNPVAMIPAWLSKNGLIDLAFVIPLYFNGEEIQAGPDHFNMWEEGQVRFFPRELEGLEIVSPRMRFMIGQAFSS
jgi:8-oxo-dGTP pyrophosphatase MutT (NUDIX family)